MLIDSHAHFDRYPADELSGILARACAAGVEAVLAIGIGDGPSTMHRALDLARAARAAADPDHPDVLASAGIYPGDAEAATPTALAELQALLADPLVVACGEIGLDYYHLESPDPAVQKAAFIAQMQLAAAARKPILIHCRTSELARPDAKAKFAGIDAWDDLLALIAEHWTPTGLPGVMHCFSGTPEQARRSLAAGFTLSFAGNLTYPAGALIREAATHAPSDRILVETDSPFLAPIPHRGETNEPAHVLHTARVLAELRGISLDELAAATTANFRRLFAEAYSTSQVAPHARKDSTAWQETTASTPSAR